MPCLLKIIFALWMLQVEPVTGPSLETESNPQLSVLAFNILTSGNPPGPDAASPLYRTSRQERIVEIILEYSPDVVLLQEGHHAQGIHSLLRKADPDWRMQDGGDRGQMILARHHLEQIGENSARVETPSGPVVVHNVHWEPYPYGPYECQKRLLEGAPSIDAKEILAASDKGEIYARTYRDIHPALLAGVPVVVGGDFNEPSHLDWSGDYLRSGPDRWLSNPTEVPLKALISWKGSRLLSNPGEFSEELQLGAGVALPPLVDSFRAVRPSAVTDPGNTWTPAYSAETVDRRFYRARVGHQASEDQPTAVLDRIDMIYASAELIPREVLVLGDSGDPSTDRGYTPWPSDHRAVLARFTLRPSPDE